MSRGEVERMTEIEAPPALVYATVTDYENYPEFFAEFVDVRILDVKEPARLVKFTAKIGMKLDFTLMVTHFDDELRTSWSYVSGKLTDSTGSWQVSDNGRGGSKVIYRLSAAVGFFVPRRASEWLIAKTMPRTFSSLNAEVMRRVAKKNKPAP